MALAKKALSALEALFYQQLVKPLIFSSRLGRRSILGYADSGLNFDHIYTNQPKGYTKFGKFVDKILLNLPACKATRARYEAITSLIQKEIDFNRSFGKKTKIIDLASGPARYLTNLITENARLVEGFCIDIDRASLKLGKNLAQGRPILFKYKNALRVGEHLFKFSELKKWRPNIILASGFYEYQPDNIVLEHFNAAYKFLEIGGLFLPILQYRNPNKKLIENVGIQKNGSSWVLYYRSPRVVKDWLVAAGFKSVQTKVDAWGQYVFAASRK